MELEPTLEASREGGEVETFDRTRLTANLPWVRAVARNLVRDPWGADDVTQETVLAALAAPPRDVPDESHLRAWLGRVAFNLSRLDARQGARRRAREARVARREALPSVSDELEESATLSELMSAIGELSEPDRRMLCLRYFDGHSTAEIAVLTGISELAVRKRLWRARAKLRTSLEPSTRRGRVLALCLGLRDSLRPLRLHLSALAAGIVLLVSVVPWLRSEGARSSARPAGERGVRTALETSAGSGVGAQDASRELPSHAFVPPTRRPSAPLEDTRPPLVSPPHDDPRAQTFAGLALDLDGRPVGGLEVFDPERPARVLATCDATGGFRLTEARLPARLEARADGWSTVVALATDSSVPAALLVAPSRTLLALVADPDGTPLDAARIELVCRELTFARVPVAVRLEDDVLRRVSGGSDGVVELADLPLDIGLALRVSAPGHRTLERPTLALAARERFVLEPESGVRLTGTVSHQDGRPAGGASVRVGLARTRADEDGHFTLEVARLEPDDVLVAADPGSAPTKVKGLESRVRRSAEPLSVVLGVDHDHVHGKLRGATSEEGWTVLAYPEDDGDAGAKDGDSACTLGEDEVPAGRALTRAGGSFDLALPRGSYVLYALAPDALRVVQHAGLDTRARAWSLEVPPAPAPTVRAARLTSDTGSALPGAQLTVLACLDGLQGKRRVAWRELTSDDEGRVVLAQDPFVACELVVEHPAVGRTRALESIALDGTSQVRAARPAFLQVADTGGAHELVLRDAAGAELVVQGPFGARARIDLFEGRSPVVEVPSEACWLELGAADGSVRRMAVQPGPGELLRLTP